MDWFDLIEKLSWDRDYNGRQEPIRPEPRPVEVRLDENDWREWLISWRDRSEQRRQQVFSKRNTARFAFVDGRIRYYLQVWLKGGVPAKFAEVRAGVTLWSVMTGIDIKFSPDSPPPYKRYFLVDGPVPEDLPDRVVILRDELEFEVVRNGSQKFENSLVWALEKELISEYNQAGYTVIWDGIVGVDMPVGTIGMDPRVEAVLPDGLDWYIDFVSSLAPGDRTPIWSGPDGRWFCHVKVDGGAFVLSGVGDPTSEIVDIIALVVPRLTTENADGEIALFPFLALAGNLGHYFLPSEYVAYLVSSRAGKGGIYGGKGA